MLATRKAVTAARDVTALGGDVFLIVAGLLAALFALHNGGPMRAALLVGFLVFARVTGWLLKGIFRRTRPPEPHSSVETFTSSFPSIHTLNSLCAVTALGMAAMPGFPAIAVLVGAVAAIGVGFTRLVFRVHWPSDVIAGYLTGLALSTAAASFLPTG